MYAGRCPVNGRSALRFIEKTAKKNEGRDSAGCSPMRSLYAGDV